MVIALLLSIQLAQATPVPDEKKSIYRVHPLLDGAITLAGAAVVIVPYGFGASLIHPRCPCPVSEIDPLDRSVVGNHSDVANTLSNVTVAVGWLVPVLADLFDVGLSRPFAEDMLVYAEALAVNGALVTIVKYLVQRPLPVVYAGQAPELINVAGGYRSFYSGHTSNVVTALMVASMTYTIRHGGTLWPWLVTGAVGASVAVERVLAGRHFYSDVAMGALAGVVVGWAIPRLHERTRLELALLPSTNGIQLSLGRTF